ncbi:hypothetical protein VHUM_00086 [Vanrija humicola]|uniref:Adenine DNA glycosylase n=1 Tax=Vanrija humicola TaxID=5417 RepID=A0A7D8Z7C3_VANHU|nr:hypothetical protein VHUM_00086 [Vanrija humicola]
MTRPLRAAARARAPAPAPARKTRKTKRAGSSPSPTPSASSSSEASVFVVSDAESEAFNPSGASSPSPEPEAVSEPESDAGRGTKRKRAGAAPRGKGKGRAQDIPDLEDLGASVHRPHARSYHSTAAVASAQDALLAWFEGVRDARGMPWRKRYDAALSMDDKGQRAYEIWVSEVMLQQTQVATVIPFWTAWIARWPTISDLATADVEEVNAAWRGLGYYRRARSLLDGAKAVAKNKDFNGRLPNDPDVLEKSIPGVGRYTAGAITSMAYGVRTPIVDGNVHRVLTRLLALHAPQAAPSTIRFLWDAATELVDALPRGQGRGIAGDWNQALMELGATVCKPAAPECSACPLEAVCKAKAELAAPPDAGTGAACDLCAPIPAPEGTATIPSVTVFPMKKEKKASREEHEAVCVTEWRGPAGSKWLFTKRPDKGLLAGLYEPPSVPVAGTSSQGDKLAASRAALAELLQEPEVTAHTAHAPVPHIFSHINMTYHVQHAVVSGALPALRADRAAWLDADEVAAANVGTGVKKVWAGVYGAWGQFVAAKAGTTRPSQPKTKPKPKAKAKPKANKATSGGGGLTQATLGFAPRPKVEAD